MKIDFTFLNWTYITWQSSVAIRSPPFHRKGQNFGAFLSNSTLLFMTPVTVFQLAAVSPSEYLPFKEIQIFIFKRSCHKKSCFTGWTTLLNQIKLKLVTFSSGTPSESIVFNILFYFIVCIIIFLIILLSGNSMAFKCL